jgi:peptidoglycan hydrolase CwlO-like protein
MKKTLILFIAVSSIFILLTGCLDEVAEEANKLKDDVTKAYDNIQTEIGRIGNELTEAQKQAEQKIKDAKDAKDAIDKLLK